MLTPEKRQKLRALNTDHHHRMAKNHVFLADTGKLPGVEEHDQQSRAAIVQAMLGCRNRFAMKGRETVPRVLELGSGSGRDIDYLCAAFDGATYYGVEIVEPVAAALRDLGRNVLCDAIEELPLEWDNHFQFVYSRHVMEHVVDVDVALAALKRVLTPNGIIGAVTPHFFPDPEPAHVTKLTSDAWIEAYHRHGLRVVYCELKTFHCKEAHIVAIHEAWPIQNL
jgi:SAM-dependent methyltransferase